MRQTKEILRSIQVPVGKDAELDLLMLLFENTHTSAPCYSYTSCLRLAAVMFLGLCSALQLFHLSRNTFTARSSPKTDADEAFRHRHEISSYLIHFIFLIKMQTETNEKV